MMMMMERKMVRMTFSSEFSTCSMFTTSSTELHNQTITVIKVGGILWPSLFICMEGAKGESSTPDTVALRTNTSRQFITALILIL
ncbi:hypothetical protein J4Q44_G00132760 [Coregonus suidteri]|uniref:Uncharacterized protein n=1 Tax=Coregonus suidteri TaxID=861788 RepID=A0AAN8LUE2_9TELE